MAKVDPQYIKNANGEKSFVILSVKEFDIMMEELENNDDIKLYDEAKKEDTGERVLFSEYLEMRKNIKA